MGNPLDDEIPPNDLTRLRDAADQVAAASPAERKRKRTILEAQGMIREAGAVDALLILEKATTERLVAAVDDALRIGSRYGRAHAVIDLDDAEQDLLVEIAGLRLNLSRGQRLRALVAALRLEVG